MKYDIIIPNDIQCMQLSNIFTAYADEAKKNKIYKVELNLPKLMGHLFLAIRDDSHIILTVMNNDEVVGMLWGALNESIWCDEVHAQDCMVYVLKEHRGGLIAKRLVDHFERWALSKGVTSILFGANSGVEDNEPATKLYSRLGYVQVGLSFRKNIGGD